MFTKKGTWKIFRAVSFIQDMVERNHRKAAVSDFTETLRLQWENTRNKHCDGKFKGSRNL